MKLKPNEIPAIIDAGARRLVVLLRPHEFWFWSGLITVMALWAALAVGRSAVIRAESIGLEVDRLEAVEARLTTWEHGFNLPEAAEELAWRESRQALAQLESTRSDPLAVAQQVARRAEELGISGVPISLSPPNEGSGNVIEVGSWSIESGGTAIQVGFQADLGSVISFVGALPPMTTVQNLTLDRAPNGLYAQAVVLTQRPTGGN